MGNACCRQENDPQRLSFHEALEGLEDCSFVHSGNQCCIESLVHGCDHLAIQPTMVAIHRPCPCGCGSRHLPTMTGQLQPHQFGIRSHQLEELMQELFRLHDLNGNGFLEEQELVQLNSKVAMLHYGRQTDLIAVKAKYRSLFREKLDPAGRPVPYGVFRQYVLRVLDALDPDPLAQEMIVEQFTAEARSARAVFHVPDFQSNSDQAFVSKLSFQSFPAVPWSNTYMVPPAVALSPRMVQNPVMYGGG